MKYYDLHTHTDFSDGEATVEYLLKTAEEKGYGLGFSDHIFCGGNDTLEKIQRYVDYVGKTDAFVGVEANIGEDYHLPDSIEKKIDYVIASTHSLDDRGEKLFFSSYFCYRSGAVSSYMPNYHKDRMEEYMETMLKAIEKTMKTQRVDILGHATVNPIYEAIGDTSFRRDWDRAVVDLCVKYHVAVEISNLWQNPHEPQEGFLKLSKESGTMFSIGSDCHLLSQCCILNYPISMIEKLGIGEDRLFIPHKK
jgi:Histidinol phosphatase and related hydrolases of the PHP family